MSRFLGKRDKHRDPNKPHHSLLGHSHDRNSTPETKDAERSQSTVDPGSAADFFGLFCNPGKAPSHDEETKIKSVRQKIVRVKGILPKDSQVLWALRSEFSKGDVNLASDLLTAMIDASEGIVSPYNPNTKLKGAVNRQAVTCYLDATLFAIFSRLDSFEAMLYNDFQNTAKERLSFLLRLWVNLLRTGQLISTDITKTIQDAIAECGWDDAKELHQQDASEAFSFITEKLNLPLLTLKMDIYHTGRQDNDDHKFINERLLEVAIPTLGDGNLPKEIKLEDCLEEYFNNRIEVKRFLERRSTMSSAMSYDSKTKGGDTVHIETVEVEPDTPLTPLSPLPIYMTSERPPNRHRSSSIIQERFIPSKEDDMQPASNDRKSPVGRLRKGSVRKEVLMPAWQFFSLIPWYTDNAPSTDAQVAAHFSSKRPVLGLCLKRYSFTKSGRAIRLDTSVDIPIEIGLPHFIQDDRMDNDGPLYGNFKLSLQSVVCHRGNSVDSGHYIALVRANPQARPSSEGEYWLRFDDLAKERVTAVEIQKALKEETPYLLFYQILPVDGDPGNLTSGEKPTQDNKAAETSMKQALTDDEALQKTPSRSTESTSGRHSIELGSLEDGRGRSPENYRRPSLISFTEATTSRKSLELLQRPESSEGRKTGTLNSSLGRTLSKLKSRSRGGSKEELPQPDLDHGPQIRIDEVTSEVENRSGSLTNGTTASHHEISTTNDRRSRSQQRREKSRSRLLKAASKTRGQDPDRECLVM